MKNNGTNQRASGCKLNNDKCIVRDGEGRGQCVIELVTFQLLLLNAN